jgi:malonyl-CoA O-methyltransferase
MSITEVKQSVKVSPAEYAAAAALAQVVGEEMLQRLEWVLLQPKVILDAGCGTGYFAELLQQRYVDAKVLAVDIAYPRLEYASRQASRANLICADTLVLPLKDYSVDLIFANLMLPWTTSVEKLLQEWRRVLRPDGLLIFTSLGPDTLQIWQGLLKENILPHFADLHDLGDALTRGRFADPVIDADYFTLTYKQARDLFRELYASDMLVDDVANGIMECPPEGFFSATFEVVFGHAWRPALQEGHIADDEGIVKIPLAHLRGRR